MIRDWTGIIIHHSKTEDGDVLNSQGIKRYHTVDKGWADIAYHFICEKINGTYEVIAGRPLNVDGAHTIGRNFSHLGFCFIGDFDKDVPEEAMIDLGVKHIAGLCTALKIYPANVEPQRKYDDWKTCPGKNFNIESFQLQVENRIRFMGGNVG